jgi:uncharacterized protein
MKNALSGLLAGIVFGVGLALGGMTQPAKVKAFLDVTGAWDPSLAFVMAGAIAVYAPAYRWIKRNALPVYAERFFDAPTRGIHIGMLAGSALFGIGWGLAGYCPGPGLVSAGTGALAGVVFVASMFGGMALFRVYEHLKFHRGPRAGSSTALTSRQNAVER